jgi:hypothetical protein
MYEEPHIIIEIYNREHNRCALCAYMTHWSQHHGNLIRHHHRNWNHPSGFRTTSAGAQSQWMPHLSWWSASDVVWKGSVAHDTALPTPHTHPRGRGEVGWCLGSDQKDKVTKHRANATDLCFMWSGIYLPQGLGLLADPKWARKAGLGDTWKPSWIIQQALDM